MLPLRSGGQLDGLIGFIAGILLEGLQPLLRIRVLPRIVRNELSIQLPGAGTDSQIATALAIRELVFAVIFNEIVIPLPEVLVYTRLGPKKIKREAYAGRTSAQRRCQRPNVD